MRFVVLVLLTILPMRASADCVILLHGLARSENSLWLMERALTAHDYHVVNHSYPSTELPFEDLVEQTVSAAISECGDTQVSFVAHSMGGIILRAYLDQNDLENLGRSVMLAPPNHGSEIVDRFGDLTAFEWAMGPASKALGTGEDSVPNQLGPVRFDLGVIAGNVTLNPATSAIIPGPDDGKVSVQSTMVEGMTSHITLPVSHTFLMNDPVVITQTINFLKEGEFVQGLGFSDAMKRIFDGS